MGNFRIVDTAPVQILFIKRAPLKMAWNIYGKLNFFLFSTLCWQNPTQLSINIICTHIRLVDKSWNGEKCNAEIQTLIFVTFFPFCERGLIQSSSEHYQFKVHNFSGVPHWSNACQKGVTFSLSVLSAPSPSTGTQQNYWIYTLYLTFGAWIVENLYIIVENYFWTMIPVTSTVKSFEWK